MPKKIEERTRPKERNCRNFGPKSQSRSYHKHKSRPPPRIVHEYIPGKIRPEEKQTESAPAEIAESEKITVEEKEIEEAIQKAKSEEEKKHLEGNKYLLAAILRQQKTLDFLKNL